MLKMAKTHKYSSHLVTLSGVYVQTFVHQKIAIAWKKILRRIKIDRSIWSLSSPPPSPLEIPPEKIFPNKF